MKTSGKAALLLALGLMQASCGAGTRRPEERGSPPAPETKPLALDAKALALGHQRVPKAEAAPLQVQPRGQTYALPLARKKVVNLERDVVRRDLMTTDAPEVERLLARGIAIVPSEGHMRRFDHAYELLRLRSVPILVSADSVLHQQHIVFNEVLKAVEQRALAPMLAAFLGALHAELVHEVRRAPNWEPAQNELAVISVARKLLDPSLPVDPSVKSRVEQDLEQIASHRGVGLSAAQSSALCLRTGGAGRCYEEDFSQYVPRGHYTLNEALQRYFRALMFLGRIGRRIKHDDELAQQALLVQATKRARASFDGKRVPATELLARIDQVLQFFVGTSDDLTLPEVDMALKKAASPASDLRLTREVLTRLRTELRQLRAPRILSGRIERYGADAAATTKQETQGLRLLGQRFAPDSAMLGQLVFAHAGPDPEHRRFAEVAADAAAAQRDDHCDDLPSDLRRKLSSLTRSENDFDAWRCLCERSITLSRLKKPHADEERDNRALTQVCRLMPSGLDVAAVMGSALAERHTAPSRKYAGYEARFAELRDSFRAEQESPPSTLYQAWLSSIVPLLEPVPRDYPTWMAGADYEKKSLRTFLASWTSLRHDTILYVKQSYTSSRRVLVSLDMTPRPPEAYGVVEPRPELYRRLKLFAAQTRLFLHTLSALPPSVSTALLESEKTFERLTQISVQQLEGKGLTKDDESYIKNIGDTLLRIASQLTMSLDPALEAKPGEDPQRGSTYTLDDALAVPLVADVHTDVNTERVLEEATGPLEWMFAVSRMPDGQLSVAVGPVFSYREFVHPMKDRLTNEKWRGELRAGADTPAPRWWSEDRPLANGFQLPCAKGNCPRR